MQTSIESIYGLKRMFVYSLSGSEDLDVAFKINITKLFLLSIASQVSIKVQIYNLHYLYHNAKLWSFLNLPIHLFFASLLG